MSYFTFDYLGSSTPPVTAHMYANSEGGEKGIRIGQIDQPDGKRFRAHLFLPDAQKSHHDTENDAAHAMITEANLWFDRMGLQTPE